MVIKVCVALLLAMPAFAQLSGGGGSAGSCAGDHAGTYPNCTVKNVTGATMTYNTLGSELTTNSNFSTNDFTGWTAGSGWTVGTSGCANSAAHCAKFTSSSGTLTQSIAATGNPASQYCYVSLVMTLAGGGISVSGLANIASYESLAFNSVSHAVFLPILCGTSGAITLTITPDAGASGNISTVSVKAINSDGTMTATIGGAGAANIAVDSSGSMALFSADADFPPNPIRVVSGSDFLAGGRTAPVWSKYNTIIGQLALAGLTAGIQNVAVGYQAGSTLNTTAGNTFLGANAGAHQVSGDQNMALGANTDNPSTTASGQITIQNAILCSGATGASTSSTTLKGVCGSPGHTGVGSAPGLTGCGTIGTGSTNNAGFYTSGTTGTCTPVFTWANSVIYTHGAACQFTDVTTLADVKSTNQTAYTTNTVTASGTTVSGDIVLYTCYGF